MKAIKKLSFLAAAALIACPSGFTTLAADGTDGYRDVEPAAWYYEAVDYCSENGIMNGMDDGLFVPDGELTRAMLVSSIYRIEGEPETDANGAFADVDDGAWYADAVNWAYASGIISGNDANLFEPDEPITKEDTAAILWRAEGSPAVDGAEDFADETSISAYAAQAVDWARVNGVIGGDGNVFDPQGEITRAETASMLYHWRADSEEKNVTVNENDGILIAYFSHTGNTRGVAGDIAGITGGDVFEIVPLEPYPEDYDAIAERSQAELDGGILPEIAGSVENMDDYDTIILGFPIWYNDIPMIINTFIESYDLDGKTIAPFSTSGSDSISGALSTIEKLCPEAEITEGLSIIGGELDSAAELAARWIDEIGIMDGETPDTSAETRRLKITVDGNEIYAELEDNATVDSLLEMLPLTQSFEDYNSAKKISYLEEKPETENNREAYDPETGYLCLYEPWGNLCFFYGDAGASSGLVPIAHVEDGMDIIAGIADGTEMTIELA